MTTGESSAFEVPLAAGRLWIALLERVEESGPAPCEVNPEAWFAPHPAAWAVAAQGCESCPAREACLAYAEAAGERHGVWGGRAFGRRTKAAS